MLQCENEYGYYGDDKEYLREVEHLRMEYFRKEAEIEPLLEDNSGKNKNSSFWDELTVMKISHLMKLSF